jgi:hypothetical protein
MTVREFIEELFEENYAEFLLLKLRLHHKDRLVDIGIREHSSGGNLEIFETEEPYALLDFYNDFSEFTSEDFDKIYCNDKIVDDVEIMEDFNFGNLELEWL